MVIHPAMEGISLSACGDGRLKPCTLIAQCTTGVQPYWAPEPNQSASGQVRLLESATHHTHNPQLYLRFFLTQSHKVMQFLLKLLHNETYSAD